MNRIPLLIVVLIALVCGTLACSQSSAVTKTKTETVTPLPGAHAHNDYEHKRPLHDALAHGFCNIEADVILVDGQLLVAHNREDVHPDRTLQSLYLDPLLKRVKNQDGHVFAKEQTLTLLVDFKTGADETYEVLRKVLIDYREMLSSVKAGKFQRGAVEIVISGNRPHKTVAAEKERYVFIDGRPNEVDADIPANLVPLVSVNWSNLFKWRGKGEMPAAERTQLRQLVELTHSQGRRLRFWATPELPAFWNELADAKVDLIGTDDLQALQEFWLTRTTK